MYYECPVCGAPYSSESEAEECAQVDDPYEVQGKWDADLAETFFDFDSDYVYKRKIQDINLPDAGNSGTH